MIPCLHPAPEGVIVDLYVQPRAGRNELVGLFGEELKVRLTSPPVDGAANRLCVEYFSKLTGLSRSDVIMTSGDKSRHKTLLLRGLSAEEAQTMIEKALAGRPS